MASSRTRVRLGDVADLRTGFPFRSSEFVVEGAQSVRLLRGDNVAQKRLRWDGVKCLPTTSAGGYSEYLLDDGDVVLAMDRPWIEAGLKVASLCEGDLPALLVQRVARLRARGPLEQRYLKWVLFDDAFTDYLKSVQTGTAIPHISAKQIADYHFSLPSTQQQVSIADILQALDDLIEADRQEARRLRQLASAIGAEFVNDVASITPPKALPEIAEIVKGYSYSSAELAPGGGSWLVGLKNVGRDGSFQRRGFKPLTPLSVKGQQIIDNGDVVVAQTDLTQQREVVGRPVRVRRGLLAGSLVASLDLAIVRPKPGYTREYLFAALSSAEFRSHALAYCNGTTVVHMGARALPEFEVPAPPMARVERFSERVRPLWELADQADGEADRLELVRDELLPLLMSGRVVPVEVAS